MSFSLSPPPVYYFNEQYKDLDNIQPPPQDDYIQQYQGYYNTQKYQTQVNDKEKFPKSLFLHTIHVNSNIPESIPKNLPLEETIFQTPTRFALNYCSWSNGENNVKDIYGNLIFTFRYQSFDIGTKIDFQDARTGAYVGSVSQQLRKGIPHYNIYIGHTYFASMEIVFSYLSLKYMLKLSNGQIIDIEGNWKEYDFIYSRDGAIIAVVSKSFSTLNESFGIEINPGEDVVLIIAATVVLDKLISKNKSKS